jgi:uncharacterized protein Usg
MNRSGLLNYNRATVEVTYHLPDYPRILQTFLWQVDDTVNRVGPKVREFLDFWSRNIEATIHSVRIGDGQLISQREIRNLNNELKFN